MAYLGKYDSPSELIEDQRLSRDEKIRMLESWRDDKEALMRATGEGMKGEVRADLLLQIENELNSLR